MVAFLTWPDGRTAWRRFLGRGSQLDAIDAVQWALEHVLRARLSKLPEPEPELLTEAGAAARRDEEGRPTFPLDVWLILGGGSP